MQICFSGSLRLYPPTWLPHLQKAFDVDVLPSGSSVAKGTDILVSSYATQQNPQLFSNPEHFDHIRFHYSQREPKLQAGFLLFGAGFRRCLDEGFAMMEAILIMATLLPFVKLVVILTWQISPDPRRTLRMKGAFYVQVTTHGRG